VTVLTAIIAIIAILGMVMTVQLSRKYRVNAAAFTAQIQKLVMANSIDRAIRLCNAVQEAPLPSAVKASSSGPTAPTSFRSTTSRNTRD